MKVMVAYYSRGGNTGKAAEAIAAKLKEKDGTEVVTEEIVDEVNRAGMIGWIKSGYHAATEKETTIKPVKTDVADCDIVVVGFPIWAGNVVPAIRTFCNQHKGDIDNFAIFCTKGGGEHQKAYQALEKILGKKPSATFDIRAKELKDDALLAQKAGQFAEDVTATSG